MDPAELQNNLEELEERIDRVRALYEQYFCGIEKIEPQIPRKDVDRRIFVLRKEQIRNTAMRFKFQVLVQRYNTMSQHWGRVLREIENGTFKRDLARAAARFGIDEALTAVGKKRAERLAKGLEAQLDREARRKQQQKKEEEYEVVDEGDLESYDDFDDDAPTPPPVRPAPAPGNAPGFGVVYADAPDDDGPGTDISEPPPAAAGPVAARGRTGFGGFGRASAPGAQPRPQDFQPTPYAPPIAASSLPPDPAGSVPPSVRSPADAQKKGGGGLRLGGGPSRRANQEALSRIAGALDGDGGEPGARKPLLSSPLDIDVGPEPAAAPAARKPLLSAPLDIDLPPAPEPARASAPSPAAAASPPEQPSPAPTGTRPAEASRPLGLKPPPRTSAEPSAARPAAKPAQEKDISDQRLREIYAQYVNSRRERNESTAGITFEKLADSLRSQADKLKSKHSAKRVDYEVVVKDGKTLIKPIVR